MTTERANRHLVQISLVTLAVLLTLGLPWVSDQLATAVVPTGFDPLGHLFLHHGLQAAMALVMIGLLIGRKTSDFGLRWPDRSADVWAATGWCLLVAIFVTLLRYTPNLLAHAPPHPDHPLSLAGFAGWTFFEGIYVGPTEEVLFRSLLIGILSGAGLGGLRLGRIKLSGAVIVSALLFGAAHYAGGAATPWWQNAFQIVYAIILGLIYGHWFERSRSLLVPAIAHNATDLLATWVSFGLAMIWR
jgi:membrane protease YdiL (CAAX protease family)